MEAICVFVQIGSYVIFVSSNDYITLCWTWSNYQFNLNEISVRFMFKLLASYNDLVCVWRVSVEIDNILEKK